MGSPRERVGRLIMYYSILAKLGASFPLVGAGLVGQDALGNTFLDDCRSNGIDPDLFRFLRELPLPTPML